MTEKRRLLPGTSGVSVEQFNNVNVRAEYGSVDGYYERLPSEDDREPNVVPVKFLYRKRDVVIVSVLAVLVLTSVLTTMAIGLPKIIRQMNEKAVITELVVVGSDHRMTTNLLAINGAIGIHTNAAVTSNCPQCSTIASNVLRRNGSSVDAAIAATFCLSVCDIHHTGLGGGFLMTVYQRKSESTVVIDARETAPSLSNETMFKSLKASSIGGLSVAVPGLVKGLWEAHKRYGQTDWSSLIEPAIEMCDNGFKVGLSLAKALKSHRKLILEEPTISDLLVNPSTGDIFKMGETLKQPNLSRTLRILAKEGGDAMYTGSLASQLIMDIRNLGGILSLDDLKNYKIRVREPVVADFSRKDGQGWLRVQSSPAPGSGSLLTFFLNIIDNFSRNSTGDLLSIHRTIESLKFVYARRALLADPDFVDLTDLISNLTSKEYARGIRELIKDNETFAPDYYIDGLPVSMPSDSGTSHVSVISPNGDAVSITSTINQKFGANVVSYSTGIILNDEMDDFSSPNVTNYFNVPPSKINFIKPGKRPLSSMCPTIITDNYGNVVLVTGASGGTSITSTTALVILRHLWMDFDLMTATDLPRFHHQLFPNVLELESGFPKDIIEGLEKIGHRIQLDDVITAVNSVSRTHPGGPLMAVGDIRVGAGQDGF